MLWTIWNLASYFSPVKHNGLSQRVACRKNNKKRSLWVQCALLQHHISTKMGRGVQNVLHVDCSTVGILMSKTVQQSRLLTSISSSLTSIFLLNVFIFFSPPPKGEKFGVGGNSSYNPQAQLRRLCVLHSQHFTARQLAGAVGASPFIF